MTPLELLCLFLFGKLERRTESKLFQHFNTVLSWDALLNGNVQTDLAPLLFHIVKENQDRLDMHIPDFVYDRLKELNRRYAVIYLAQAHAKKSIFSIFSDYDIDFIPLKGAALAEDLYPDAFMRPLGDIDLLIRKTDINKAVHILDNNGYQPYKETRNKIALAQQDSIFHLTYCKTIFSVPIIIELHYAMARKVFVRDNIFGFWDDAMHDSCKQHLYHVSVETQLYYLCWHFFQHIANNLSFRFIWLIDIALLLKKHYQTIDWNILNNKIRTRDKLIRIKVPFFIVAELFNLDFHIPSNLKPSNWEKALFNMTFQRYGQTRYPKLCALPLNIINPYFLLARTYLHIKARTLIYSSSARQ